jgi:hypothetical protein
MRVGNHAEDDGDGCLDLEGSVVVEDDRKRCLDGRLVEQKWDEASDEEETHPAATGK